MWVIDFKSRKVIDFKSRNKWMSPDEYVGGNFLIWNWIDIYSWSQSFKLAKSKSETIINNRSGWIIRDMTYLENLGSADVLTLSADWYIESIFTRSDWWNAWQTSWAETSQWFWALYRKSSWNVIWSVWDDVYIVATNKLDRLKSITADETAWIMDTVSSVVNPLITSSTWWTVGTWWTPWAWWAVHTHWNVADLSQNITPTYTGKIRVTVRVTWHTAWTVQVKWRWSSMWTLTTQTNTRLYTFVTDSWWTSAGSLAFTPSLTFDWTINFVSWREYNTNLVVDEVTLSGSDPRCSLADRWSLYIWSDNYVNVIDTTISTWNLDTTLTLPSDQKVIWITRIWDTYNIYSKDALHSYQWLWNWVDTAPAERILRENIHITSVDNDGNYDMVLCQDSVLNIKTYLYKVSWWQKSLLSASKSNAFLPTDSNQNRCREECNALHFPSNWRWITSGWWFTAITWRTDIYLYGSPNPAIAPWFTKYAYNGEISNYDYIPFVKFIGWRFYTNYVDDTQSTPIDNQLLSWDMSSELWTNYPSWEKYLISNPIIWDKQSSVKKLKKIKIWCKFESPNNQINLYIRVDDTYFITFYVSWVTTTPSIWAVYTIPSWWEIEVISTDISWWIWTISGKYTVWTWLYYNLIQSANSETITKTSWDWDTTINTTDNDHYIKLASFTWSSYNMYWELAVTPEMLAIKIPDWHKLQFKIGLVRWSWYSTTSPEVYNVSILADVIKNDWL